MKQIQKWLKERISTIDEERKKIDRQEIKNMKDLNYLRTLSIKREVYCEVIHYTDLHEKIELVKND